MPPSDGAQLPPPTPTGDPAPASGPRAHADPVFLAAKQARWFEPRVAPVNRLVGEIAETTGLDVPHVDPDSGGVDTRVLLLLEAPSGVAAHRARMTSVDNDDGTAANLWRAHVDAGLSRQVSMIWNAVPWYLGVQGRIDAPRAAELTAGRAWLVRVLDLLPTVQVVIALGRVAEKSLRPLRAAVQARDAIIVAAPHPSQRVYNVPGRGARAEVHRAFLRAAEVVGDGT